MADLSGLRRTSGLSRPCRSRQMLYIRRASMYSGNRMAVPGHLQSRRAMFGIPHQRREEFDRAALVHVPELLRVASRLCGSADAGEDLLQETYLQAWRSFHRFEAGTNCRAWLYKILLFTYSAQNRKRARQPFLVDLDAAGETALLVDAPTPDTLTAEAVKTAFDRLPEHFRTLVLLVDVDGLTLSRSGGGAGRPDRHRDVPSEPRSWTAAPGAGATCPGIVNRSAKRNGPVCTAEGAVVNLDCQHVREVMDSYLSEELSVETNHGVLRHVAECRDCAAELKRRRRLRAMLSETLDVAVDADRARARITHAVDREQRSWERVARLGAVAATLIAAVAVVVLGGQARRRSRL